MALKAQNEGNAVPTPAPYSAARSAGGLFVLAVLSPAAGLAVEMALAWRFGVSETVDAFRIASVFLVLGQQLLVMQVLPHVIVPVFTDLRTQGREREAWRAVAGLLNLLLALTGIAATAVFLWPEPLVRFLAPGLEGAAAAKAVLFLRWFALAYLPLVVTGTAAGVLQTYGVFWPTPTAQLAAHLLLVAFVVLAGSRWGAGALVGAVLAAGVLGAALHAGRALLLYGRQGGGWEPASEATTGLWPGALSRAVWRDPGVRRALRLALPLAGLFVVAQWAAVVVNREISRGPEGALAAFGYAFKLGLLVSLAPLALATVLYPRLAARASHERHAAAGEFAIFGGRALRMGLFLALPLAAVCFALRDVLVALAFERGAFPAGAVDEVAGVFGWLLLGAPAAVATAYLEKMHYARECMWTPAAVRAAGVALLTALAPVLAAHDGARGVAALLSLLSLLTAAALLFLLPRREAGLRLRELTRYTVQLLALASAAGWVAAQVAVWLGSRGHMAALGGPLVPAAAAAMAAALYFAGARALALPEAAECARFLRWQSESVWRRCVGSPSRG